LRIAIATALTAAPALALAAPPAKPAPAPLAPLSILPSVPRVKIGVTPAQVVVTEEVNLPRGEWKGEALDLYVAFGAPGAPRAIDAHLVAVADGSLEPADDDAGEPCATERAPRRPATAHALLGRETMAGIVVHLKKDALERALAPGNMAALRIRTVLDLPEEDASGGRSVLVRLGASRGTPLTLGRIVVAPSGLAVTKAEARLCGPDADPHPLALSGVPRAADAPIAPVLAVRHSNDDLCVRIFVAP
jgi:hypothetical protein